MLAIIETHPERQVRLWVQHTYSANLLVECAARCYVTLDIAAAELLPELLALAEDCDDITLSLHTVRSALRHYTEFTPHLGTNVDELA